MDLLSYQALVLLDLRLHLDARSDGLSGLLIQTIFEGSFQTNFIAYSS